MKRLIFAIGLIIAAAMPAPAPAEEDLEMQKYCSAPPYSTRTIPPNIMILMDNSQDMLSPAYGGDYDTVVMETTGDSIGNDNGVCETNEECYFHTQYTGYFIPSGCYQYSTNKFVEVLNGSRSYKEGETCPATAPFRGNLMNWATMSKFDILEKVLIGGNSASKQGNAHSLVSLSGVWADKYFPNSTSATCIFRVNNANLTILDYTAGSCGLLDSPAVPVAFWHSDGLKNLFAWVTRGFRNAVAVFAKGWKGLEAAVPRAWENIHLVADAGAASACSGITISSSLNGTVGTPYGLVLDAAGCNNCTFTWGTISFTPAATWLTGPTYIETATHKVNGRATWTGTPTAAGTYNFTATATSAGCTGTMTKSGTITISAATLIINTTALPAGTVNTPYSFTLQGQGGVTPYSWTATGLPAGLSLDSSTGVISGTPTAVGTYSVGVTLNDSYSGNDPDPLSTFSLVISSTSIFITTPCPVPNGVADPGKALDYEYTFAGSGGITPYTWELVSGSYPTNTLVPAGGGVGGIFLCPGPGNCVNPNGFSQTFAPGTIYGDAPNVNATYSFTITLRDSSSPQKSTSKSCSLTFAQTGGVLTILTTSLQEAVKGDLYSYTVMGAGGTSPYTWSATGLPACLSMSSAGVISGTCALSDVGTYSVTITLTDAVNTTVTKTLSLKVVKTATTRSSSFNVKVDLVEETLVDVNGNDIFDDEVGGESYTDTNGNGKWDGKTGVFQRFWDATDPRARWGLANFSNQGATVNLDIDSCIPAAPASSFYTRIQNATPTDTSPLSKGLYGVINFFGFSTGTADFTYDADSYRGCTNSDPIDDIPCRKNFILTISSGADLSGSNFSNDTCTGTAGYPITNPSAPLVQNACYGFNKDLRKDKNLTQNAYTYIVNPGGTNATNNLIMKEAAQAGNGKYYYGGDAATLEAQLIAAIQDILAQAASGTAVSVLTTSSRGVGSVVQAYFLPKTSEGTRDVWWTGYLQNLWIDPLDNLRDDSSGSTETPPVADYKLELDKDDVIKLYFNPANNQTEVALFTTTADGTGGTLATCLGTDPDIKPFSEVTALWEAGKKLAIMNPSDRNIFTSKKVLRDTTTTHTISANIFETSMDAALQAALNPEAATYTANSIIRYVRGECLETGVTGNTSCGGSVDENFRDRRLTVGGAMKVWKLGDIISSTPKVLATMGNNTYTLDYSDGTYNAYASSTTFTNRSSTAFVGANDGMLHAFRVGFLKDSGLSGTIKALFKNFYNSADDVNTKLGDEMWGYIPFNAFPYLKYLAKPEYSTCHIYYNDLSVRLVDVSIGDSTAVPGDVRTTASWRTVLIGGMRFGGSCSSTTTYPTDANPDGPPAGTPANVGWSSYFAIDVTNVGTTDNPASEPVPLWEFTESDMGYSSTYPSIVRTGDNSTNGNWYVVVGSGSTAMPSSGVTGRDIARTRPGYVYLLDLKTGERKKKINIGHNGIVGDILAIDADKNYGVEKLYFGTSYYDTTNAVWRGKLMSIALPVPETTALDDTNWASPTVTEMFDGPYPFTASPDAARDANGKVWVYAGSGKYYTDKDEQDTSSQIFMGFNDTDTSKPITEGAVAAGATVSCTAGQLCDVTHNTTTGDVSAVTKVCAYDGTQFGLQDVVTSVASSSTAPTNSVGWKIYLSSGERSISRPLAVGGLVDFLTYLPSGDVCSYGGDSFLYSVDYTTGVAPKSVAIRAPGATTGTTVGSSVTVNKKIGLGPGAPPTGEAIIIPPQKEGQEQLKKKIQVATGVIVEAENKPVISTASKVIHWLKK